MYFEYLLKMKKVIKKNKKAHKTKKEKKKEMRKKEIVKEKQKNKINKKNNNAIIKEKENIEDKNKIKGLLRDIFKIREAKRQLAFVGIDYKNILLDKKEELFKKGCDLLNSIDEIINSNKMDHKSKKDKYFQLSKEYYKLIPHTFPFPDYNLYLINNIEKIKREICLLELIKSYSELEKTFNRIRNEKEENDLNSMNLNDSLNISVNNLENIPEGEHQSSISNNFYEKALLEFNYKINVVHEGDEYNKIKYLIDSYSTEYGGPFPPLKVLEIFSLKDSCEEINTDILYFYGCEIIHFYSILKNGLRLPMKAAPKNAFSYGKGILLSDNPFDQIQKCLPKNNIVYLFICKVDKFSAKRVHIPHKNYPERLDKKYDSVLLKTRFNFPVEDSSDENSKDHMHSYNFILYHPSLAKLCYIVKVEIP